MNECEMYGENCSTTLNNWVFGMPTLTIFVNILIIIVALIALIIGITMSIRSIRRSRLPLCVDCQSFNQQTHTKFTYGPADDPVCEYHWNERDMAAEPTYTCPKHNVPLGKERQSGVTIDVCPQGCIFLEDGELDTIKDAAESSGRSNGQMTGFVIGSIIN